MRDRASAFAVALALALAVGACSGTESKVVDQYFTALKANDTNTLTSFALVQFDQPVQDWKVTQVGPDTKAPAALPDLVKRQKDAEAELAQNTRDARAWGNDLSIYTKLDQVRALEQKNAKIPAALEPIKKKWDAFNEKDRELKKAVADAKDAVEHERRDVVLSVGNVDDLESLKGESITKNMDLTLTIKGEAKPYVMTLRRYELTGNTGGRMISRWVVQSLTPKS
jgi:hypothetical protein